MSDHFTHTAAADRPHHLVLGTVAVTRLLGGDETGGELALVELRGLPGSGPGPHLDPWRESFHVLEGELTFRYEEGGAVRTQVARAGDSVSIPRGVGHAFTVTSAEPARYQIVTVPAGIEAFFADAGEPIDAAEPPAEPPAFDRPRLLAAFARHGLTSYGFPDVPSGP